MVRELVTAIALVCAHGVRSWSVGLVAACLGLLAGINVLILVFSLLPQR